jgi:Mg-chelatase subunit ChlD
MNREVATRPSEIQATVPPTLIAVILDESGSMGVARDDVIGGFNRFVDDQRALPDHCRLSLTKFNTVSGVFYPPTVLSQLPPLDEATYTPGGGTALFDAIAETVRVAQHCQHGDERVLCLIITDGQENSSRETTRQQVTDLIRSLEARGDWTFVYLGVTPDQFVRDMGLAGTRTATNTATYDPGAPRLGWDTISSQTAAFRSRTDRSTTDFYRPRTGA